MVEPSLTGAAALVTGGGAGIGRGIAVALAGAGADIAIVDVDPGRAEVTAAEVRAAGRTALVLPTNVMETDQVTAAVETAAGELGRLDVLVNNAGGVRGAPFLEQSERSWRRHIDLNLVSMLAATAAAVPVMIEGGRGGAILNVASIEAERAAPMYAVYAACKAGMVSFTRTMAVELSDHGIRVNAIAPDKTATPGLRGLRSAADDEGVDLTEVDPSFRDAVARSVPLGREGTIAECGELAVFLCSERAAYITGASIPIDGGTAAAGGWIRDGAGGWSLSG
jgi:NAD(P)-dependent dehydrogenase (short-subunit alcohol dehydrogenase family)